MDEEKAAPLNLFKILQVLEKRSCLCFLCFFFDGAKVIITNAYEKKSAKMPQREKLKALNAKKDYIKRCKQEEYYE